MTPGGSLNHPTINLLVTNPPIVRLCEHARSISTSPARPMNDVNVLRRCRIGLTLGSEGAGASSQ